MKKLLAILTASVCVFAMAACGSKDDNTLVMATNAEFPPYEFYEGDEIVGRIGAIINHAANEKWGTSNVRFTRFDFVDDFEVSSALFNKVVEWARERGYKTVSGPHGFTDMDHEGMLVEGFDELNMSITFYNLPYYVTHMEKLGLEKDVDWVEYFLTVPETHDTRIERISKYLQERSGYLWPFV